MSGFGGGGGGGVGGIVQITGSGGIAITNPFGPITNIGGAAVPCASYAVAGRVEIATLTESFDGTYLGATGCPLALSPANQSFREETLTGAMFTPFSSPVSIVSGFGANALDVQPGRNAVWRIASGARAICLGQDNEASAGDALCLGQDNYSRGTRGVSIGSTNTADFNNTCAIGYRNVAGDNGYSTGDSLAVGRSNFATYQSSVAVGVLNNADPTNLDDNTGAIVNDPQAVNSGAVNSTAVGVANTVYGTCSSACGFKNDVIGYCSSAFGYKNSTSANFCVAIGAHNSAPNVNSSAVGYFNAAGGTYSTAVGYRNSTYGSGAAFGISNFTSAWSGVAVGILNNVYAPANLDDITGAVLNNPQATGVSGTNSSAFGLGNTSSGLRATCLGFKNIASGIGSTAIGDRGIARIQDTVNIAGPLIIRKDDGEPIADAFRVFAGAEDIILTDEVNLAAIANQTIALPAGCHFWVSECGIILTELTGVITTQPTIQFGIAATPAKFMAPVLTTLLTAVLKRERFQVLLSDDGETTLLAGVTAGAVVGTSMSGRFFWRGVLVEDE